MSNNPNSDAHGWANWTSNKNRQQTNEQRITELEKRFRSHQGIDFAAAGPDHPHPSQRVRTLIFYEGNGRLDPTGIQVLYDDIGDKGIYWLPDYTDTPGSVFDGMSLTGILSGGVGRLLSMKSIAASGVYAQVDTYADATNAFARLKSAIGGNSATLSYKSAVTGTSNATLAMSSTGVDGVVIQPEGIATDPLTATDGQLFWRSDTNRYRVRLNGTYYNLALGDVPTSMNVQPYAAKTTTYTTTNADGVISVDATSASFTVTLVASSGNAGLTQTFKKINAANVVTIDANSAELIDGLTTYALSAQWSWVTLVCTGSGWLIVAQG